MAIVSPYLYSIKDPTAAWVAAGAALETAVDTVVRTQAQQKDYPAAGKANTMAFALEEIRQIFNGDLAVNGPFIIDSANDAVKADANAGADELIVGNLASSTAAGMTVLNTSAGTGWYVFSSSAGAITAGVKYVHSTGVLTLRTASADRVHVHSTYFRPQTDDALSLGGASNQWSDLRSVLGTFSGAVNMSSTLAVNGQFTAGVAGVSATHVINGDGTTFRDLNTDATNKSFLFKTQPFTSADGQWVWARVIGQSGLNRLDVGGSTGNDSATEVRVITSTATNTTGTLRASWDTAGLFAQVGAATIGGTLAVGGGAISDAASTADDLVIGTLAGASNGMTMLSTAGGSTRLAITSSAGVMASGLIWESAGSTWRFWSAGANVLSLTSGLLIPAVTDAVSLGRAANQWSDMRSVLGTFSGAVNMSSTLTVDGSTILGDADGDTVAIGGITVGKNAGLQVLTSAAAYQIITTDVNTNATQKNSRWGFAHYTNTEQPVGILYGVCSSGASSLNFGGGTSLLNAPTSITFWTAANNITTTGTKQLDINGAGLAAFTGAATIGGTLGVTGVASFLVSANVGPAPSGAPALVTGELNIHNTATTAAAKSAFVSLTHYTNTEKPMMVFRGKTDGTDNFVYIGGSNGNFNAATRIEMWTAANDTTVTGTLRAYWDLNGLFRQFGDALINGALELDGAFNHDGTTFGVFAATPVTQRAAYTRTATIVESRTLAANASATAANNNAVLASLIDDMQTLGFAA